MKKKSELLKKRTDEKRVIEETDSVQKAQETVAEDVNEEEERFVIKVGNDKWLQSWSKWQLCDDKSDAVVLNADWARGHSKRIMSYKHMKAEVVRL